MLRWGAAALLAVVAGGTGCARVTGRLPAATQAVAGGELVAGAAVVDITPPPGFAMGGHSIEGQLGRGILTRLSARSLYLESARGQSLVLTITDLWGMPGGLADRVTEIATTEHGLTGLDRDTIVVAATHTHHGPANFATSRVFSRFVGPRPGFDPVLFEFLAQRIAASIARAAASARPAVLRYAQRPVPGVARNRSVEPFVRNPEAREVLDAGPRDAACHVAVLELAGPPPADPCRAVDPGLRVLRVDAVDDPKATIALVGVFAMHPTAMPNSTSLYSGDAFAVATAHAETLWGDTGGPMVALFNGAEGDVSPNWSRQDRSETVRLGTALGEALVSAGMGAGTIEADRWSSAYARVTVADQAVTTADGSRRRTADRGLPGTATIGGAEDGRTRWHARGYTEGRVARRERLAGHGAKRPPVAAGILKMGIPRSHVPRDAAVGVYGLGPLVFTTLPGEFTTVMGLRVRREVARATGVPLDHVIALGLAHAHLEYFATPQEYALQHYEGSSTFYGPYAGSLIAQRSGEVAAAGAVQIDRSFGYRPGRLRRFRPRPRRLASRERKSLARDLSIDALTARPSVRFVDAAPTWPPTDPLVPVTPRVRLEARRGATWGPTGIDDDTAAFATIAVRDRGGRWEWVTWWLDGPAHEAPVRVRITGVDGMERCSPPITGVAQVRAGEC